AVGITMGEFSEKHNALITPTVGIPPFEAGHDVPPGSGLSRWPQWAGFSYPFNMTGQPAISVPVGTTAAGLPVGLQIVGPRHADDLVLAIARCVEWLLAWAVPTPHPRVANARLWALTRFNASPWRAFAPHPGERSRLTLASVRAQE